MCSKFLHCLVSICDTATRPTGATDVAPRPSPFSLSPPGQKQADEARPQFRLDVGFFVFTGRALARAPPMWLSPWHANQGTERDHGG